MHFALKFLSGLMVDSVTRKHYTENLSSLKCRWCNREYDTIEHRYFSCILVNLIWKNINKMKKHCMADLFLLKAMEVPYREKKLKEGIFWTSMFGIHKSYFNQLESIKPGNISISKATKMVKKFIKEYVNLFLDRVVLLNLVKLKRC